jgi:hypothetical protein
MTVWPNDDGTIIVIDTLGEREYREWEVEADPLLSVGDKRFLRSMFRYARPIPVSCRVPS